MAIISDEFKRFQAKVQEMHDRQKGRPRYGWEIDPYAARGSMHRENFENSNFTKYHSPLTSHEELEEALNTGQPLMYLVNPLEMQFLRVRIVSLEYNFYEGRHHAKCKVEVLKDFGRREKGDLIEVNFLAAPYFQDYHQFYVNHSEKRKKTMNFTNVAALVNDNVTTLTVIYSDDLEHAAGCKHYTFKVDRGLAKLLQPGDRVVVADNKNKITKVTTVVEIHDASEIDVDSGIDYCWVVDKVHTAQFETNVAQELRIANELKRARKRSVAQQAIANIGVSEKEIQSLILGTHEEK